MLLMKFKKYLKNQFGFVLIFLFAMGTEIPAFADCVLAPPGMIGWWDADEVAGTTAFDIKGGNDGNMVNGVSIDAGKVGDAFSFNPSSYQHIVLPIDAGIFTNAFTIDAWANPTDTVPAAYVYTILDNDDQLTGGPRGIFFGFRGGQLLPDFPFQAVGVFHNTDGAQFQVLADTIINDFRHYALTYNGSALCIYINGIQEACTPANGDVLDNNLNFKIAGNQLDANPNRNFRGTIDEVEIFTRALSVDEIQAVFNAGSAGKCKIDVCAAMPAGLQHWWTMDGDPTLGIAEDIQGNADGIVDHINAAAGVVNGGFEFLGSPGVYSIESGIEVLYPLIDFIDNNSTINAITIEAWIKTDPTGSHFTVEPRNIFRSGTPIVFSFQQPAGYTCHDTSPPSAVPGPCLSFEFVGDTTGVFKEFEITTVGVAMGGTPYNLSDDAFHHVVVTYDSVGSQELRMYVDGELVKTSPFSEPLRNNNKINNYQIDTFIGAACKNGTRCEVFDGVLDEVTLYERALSAPEIEAIYTASSAGKCLNNAPTAEAGANQSIHVGDLVQLNGSGSSDDISATEDLIYIWSYASVPMGSTAVLIDANTPNPSFVADVVGTYDIQLVVTDEGGLLSLEDIVSVSSDNLAPNADAGTDKGSYVGSPTQLDGSNSSDPDSDDLMSFAWNIMTQPASSVSSLSNSTSATASFVPDLPGEYRFSLTVSDGYYFSPPDEVTVSVITAEDYVESQTVDALNTVSSLPPSSFTNPGNRTAISNYLTQALDQLQKSKINKAIDKLEKALERTDGCALRGSPDTGGGDIKKDFLTNCGDQAVLYDLLTGALATLAP